MQRAMPSRCGSKGVLGGARRDLRTSKQCAYASPFVVPRGWRTRAFGAGCKLVFTESRARRIQYGVLWSPLPTQCGLGGSQKDLRGLSPWRTQCRLDARVRTRRTLVPPGTQRVPLLNLPIFEATGSAAGSVRPQCFFCPMQNGWGIHVTRPRLMNAL